MMRILNEIIKRVQIYLWKVYKKWSDWLIKLGLKMENESIEAKQQYLRENIIDAGYDA